ncbi:Bud site selection protein 6 [Podila minutissima]|nr:Bud site selection protein 6 [Podila minutissima]
MDPIQEYPRQSLDYGSPQSSHTSPTTTRRRKTDQGTPSPIEATVTKLLVATKQLLEGLTLWSTRKMSEEQVSDIFVQLATQFNLASQSFHEVGIDTSELAHIPDDLRNCLETALGEDPSPTSLEQYLPKIKEVIINLLQGLRLKQNLYREHYEAKSRLSATQLPPQPPTVPTPSTPPPTTTQVPSTPARSRISGNHLRQPSLSRPTDSEGSFSSRPNSASVSTASPVPAFAVSSPRDEPLHAETLASLRKSDAITRRASSRRHSQRFSTLLEQNAPPPMPRRHPDSNHLSAYPGYQYPVPSLGTSSNPSYPSMPYGQSPTPPMPAPNGTTPQATGTMDTMPLPPTVPVPLPPPLETSQPTLEFLDVDSTPPAPSSDVGVSTGTESTDAPPPIIVLSEAGQETVPRPAPEPIVEPVETSLTLYLQVGKSVKKTRFEGGELTHSGLRMLFMEKFQYNPGQDDFPTIYVKDPHTNIHYELESLADVKQNAFLSLNVDEMENIQRKMDQGFAALTKEIHDIKKSHEALEQARQKAEAAEQARQKISNSQPDSEGSQALRSVVQKVLLAKNKPSALSTVALSPSNTDAAQTKISAAELKAQHEEIQTLRRDLGIVRQLYTELQTETKSMLGNLAGYTSQIRKQALEAPMSSRLFIESGKVKLDKKSEDLTNKIEDLQDVVEDMKLNVTQRRGRPSDTSMAFVDKQCDEIGQEIAELSDYIQTLRPSWKKTWEVELQTIVKEQMFLKEQEALLEDLKEDRASLLQTLGNLRKLMELQVKAGGPIREFVFQPPVDEGFEGLKTVMEEVKMIAPDSDKRLKAMAQMEKLRHIELSNRIDEFEEELTSFVGESKLRKTGGALEVERQRQQRDLENLKAMFGTKTASQESLVPATPTVPIVSVKEVGPVEEMANEP